MLDYSQASSDPMGTIEQTICTVGSALPYSRGVKRASLLLLFACLLSTGANWTSFDRGEPERYEGGKKLGFIALSGSLLNEALSVAP